jgi:hypothetical protein
MQTMRLIPAVHQREREISRTPRLFTFHFSLFTRPSPRMPRKPKTVTLTVPADYQVWLAELRTVLDKERGARMDLGRHVAETSQIKEAAARVHVSRILNGHSEPSASLFLTLAAWLQTRKDADAE